MRKNDKVIISSNVADFNSSYEKFVSCVGIVTGARGNWANVYVPKLKDEIYANKRYFLPLDKDILKIKEKFLKGGTKNDRV